MYAPAGRSSLEAQWTRPRSLRSSSLFATFVRAASETPDGSAVSAMEAGCGSKASLGWGGGLISTSYAKLSL